MLTEQYLVNLETAAIEMRKSLAEMSNVLKGGSYTLSPGGPLSDCAGTAKIHIDRMIEEAQRCSKSLALSRGEDNA